MAQFSISDAAFTGFGIVRLKPAAVAIWVVAQLVVSGGVWVLLELRFGPLLQQISSLTVAQSQDPARAMALYRQLLPLDGYATLFSLIFYSILFATMNRAVLRPKDDAFGYIRIGADEFRQLGLMLIFLLFGVGGAIVLVIVATMMAAVLGGGAPAAAAALLIVLPLFLCAMVFCMVRFSLASAQTFATKKIDVFGSWSLTKGQALPIFGAYLVAFCLSVVVTLLGAVVILAARQAAGGQDMWDAMTGPQLSLAAFLAPARIIQLVLSAALGAISWPIVTTPAPAIYRAIVGDGAVRTVIV
jgi:hypothetical protein